jgi:tetratricopeptide (TPR) repeat protein
MTHLRCALVTSVAALCALACGPALAGEEQRVAAEEAMHTLKVAGKYEEALEAAKLLIEYTTDQYGEKSAELINPYIELGDIQRSLKHPERGVESYQHAADLIEMNEGVFSDSLVACCVEWASRTWKSRRPTTRQPRYSAPKSSRIATTGS